MFLRAVWLLAFAALPACDAALAAAPQLPPAPGHAAKLTIYLANGAANACGVGCDRWIAVEGSVDRDAAIRFRDFLRGMKDTRLPFYFHSPGGDVAQSLAIGRMLRARKAIARVGHTEVMGCPGPQYDDACLKVKTTGSAGARIVTQKAMCNSACSYLFLGATTREVAPHAVLGVHNSKLFIEFRGQPNERQRAEATARSRREADLDVADFVRSMGISHDLIDLVKTVPFESGHALTRAELYRFRIDTRMLVETEWALDATSGRTIRKRVVAGKLDGSFQNTEMLLSCAGKDRARLMLVREFDSRAPGLASMMLQAGEQKLATFGALTARIGAFAAWSALLPAANMKTVLATPRVQISESGFRPDGGRDEARLDIETRGLELAWTELAAGCAAAPGTAACVMAAPTPAAIPVVGEKAGSSPAP